MGRIVLPVVALGRHDAPARTARTGRRLAAALGVTVLLTACGGSSGEGDGEGEGDAGAARASSTTDGPSTTTSTTAPTTTPATLPPAADGANLAACSDGTCEVLVSTFPVDIPFGGAGGVQSARLELTEPDRVTLSHTSPDGGGGSATVGVGGMASFGSGGSNLAVRPVAILDGAAVVQFSAS